MQNGVICSQFEIILKYFILNLKNKTKTSIVI